MQRDGEDVREATAALARKNCGGAVALMDIAIDSHRRANLAVPLHTSNGDGHIMDHAEAFAVVGKRVMKSSADVDGDSVMQCILCRKNRSACRQPEGGDKLGGKRDFEFHLLARA